MKSILGVVLILTCAGFAAAQGQLKAPAETAMERFLR
jgi:hypothetical protein